MFITINNTFVSIDNINEISVDESNETIKIIFKTQDAQEYLGIIADNVSLQMYSYLLEQLGVEDAEEDF